MLKEKITRIQTLLKAQDIATLVIGNTGHQVRDDLLYYLLLTHLEVGIMHIPARGKATLFAIPFEVTALARTYPELRVLPLTQTLSEYFKTKKDSTLAYRPSALPARFVSKHMKPLSDEETVMGIKLPEEIRRMKHAAKITDAIFSELIANWHTFKTEEDVARRILVSCAERGVEPSFPPIVASGKHAADPHHHPTNKKLIKGFCVIDMGVRYRGYCSDMTRTIYIGTPSEKEKKVYETLLSVQNTAITQSVKNANIQDIATAVRGALGDYEKYFTHALGHGLGTQVHEWPPVSTRSDITLSAGMAITIEPGIYVPQHFGIRIEDDIVITDGKPVILTKSPKQLITV